MKKSLDNNIIPDEKTCKEIISGIWTLYLRTPKVKRANEKALNIVDHKIDNERRIFMKNFGAVIEKTIYKLFPKVFQNTRSIFYHASGENQFLTTDNPSSPCINDVTNGKLIRCDEYELQKAVILSDVWPVEVGLLCPLTPTWCVLVQSVSNDNSVECFHLNSLETSKINQFIRGGADRFVILPPKKD